jgi:hypothetical protein
MLFNIILKYCCREEWGKNKMATAPSAEKLG